MEVIAKSKTNVRRRNAGQSGGIIFGTVTAVFQFHSLVPQQPWEAEKVLYNRLFVKVS